MDYLEKCFKKTPSFVFRKIDNEIILVPIRRDAADLESIYYFSNDVAIFIYELIDGEKRLQDILKAIVYEFEVDTKQAEDELIGFTQQLERIGCIKGV